MEHGQRCLHHRLLDSNKSSVGSPQRLMGPALRALATQIAAAICFLHERRICHRDVKPESFHCYGPNESPDLDAGPTLKLTNFDLAVRQPHGVLIGTSCGTAPFAAPEVGIALQGRYDG